MFEQILMKKNIVALGIFLGTILYTAIWMKILDFSFNYREIKTHEGFLLFSVIFFVFYKFGIYINAVIFRLSSKPNSDIAPSAVLLSSISSFILSFFIIAIILLFGILGNLNSSIHYIVLGILLLLQLIGIRAGCTFKNDNYISFAVSIRKIATVLIFNVTLLLVVCITDFSGVNSSIEVRQKWAYKKFRHYPAIVNSIKENNYITDKVGQIRFVAPTKGRNLHIDIGASSGPTSKLTLEVVGEKGIGIAYLTTWGSSIHGLCFEYKGKKTKLWGSGKGCHH